jgi:hypothetical protein
MRRADPRLEVFPSFHGAGVGACLGAHGGVVRSPGSFGFWIGVIVGLLLGGTGTAIAVSAEPRLIGGSGYLLGWDVQDDSGEPICSDP